jgi:Holliday junction DNA helicase RuvB
MPRKSFKIGVHLIGHTYARYILARSDQQYLQIVAEGATRLNVVASMLGLPSRTVAEVTEPFLLRAGYLLKDDQGRRQLTALGRERVQELSR